MKCSHTPNETSAMHRKGSPVRKSQKNSPVPLGGLHSKGQPFPSPAIFRLFRPAGPRHPQILPGGSYCAPCRKTLHPPGEIFLPRRDVMEAPVRVYTARTAFCIPWSGSARIDDMFCRVPFRTCRCGGCSQCLGPPENGPHFGFPVFPQGIGHGEAGFFALYEKPKPLPCLVFPESMTSCGNSGSNGSAPSVEIPRIRPVTPLHSPAGIS